MLGAGLSIAGAAARGRRGFTPADFFTGGADGLFLDARSGSALFQDPAGVTPAAPAGDPVRLALDKSQGLTLGPELAAGATTVNAPWADNGGGAYAIDGSQAANVTVFYGGLVEAGTRCKVVLEVSSLEAAGTLRLVSNPNDADFGVVSAPGDYTAYLEMGSVNVNINAGPDGFAGTVRLKSVREIPGAHAAAPSDAARPAYQAGFTLTDDGADDALIVPLTGTYSAYIAAGGALIADENAVMANDYDVLRNGMAGAVIVAGTLSPAQQQQVAGYFGVTV